MLYWRLVRAGVSLASCAAYSLKVRSESMRSVMGKLMSSGNVRPSVGVAVGAARVPVKRAARGRTDWMTFFILRVGDGIREMDERV